MSEARTGSRITVEYGDTLLTRIERQKSAEGFVSLSEFLRQVAINYLAEIEEKKRAMMTIEGEK